MALDLGGGIKMELVWISPGAFEMGSPDDEAGGMSDERPLHRVTVSRGFWMGKYEVTQKQYEEVTGSNPSKHRGAKNPVEMVTWHEAKVFCQAMAERTGKPVRLPTEAEWEYACRAGTSTRYHAGDSDRDLTRVGWWRSNSGREAHPVGRMKPNAWGLYDMHGNVLEWVADWYGADYYQRSLGTVPQGPTSGSQKVVRGGCWYRTPDYCRAAYRGKRPADARWGYLGFRVISPSPP